MSVEVTYPHLTLTGEPAPLTAKQIWAVAKSVRGQLVDDGWQRLIEPAWLASTSEAFTINGLPFTACWDFDHDVRNTAGERVLGATEFDPAQPDSVMVSVNGAMLGGDAQLLLSTTAHELGHVVFDAPGWIKSVTSANRAGFADVTAALGEPAVKAGSVGVRDWREFRANEFMGALLAPAALLRVDLQRFAKRHRFIPSDTPSRILLGAPAYDAWSIEPELAHELLALFAERYGVTETFIRVRLNRYDLVRTGCHGAYVQSA